MHSDSKSSLKSLEDLDKDKILKSIPKILFKFAIVLILIKAIEYVFKINITLIDIILILIATYFVRKWWSHGKLYRHN